MPSLYHNTAIVLPKMVTVIFQVEHILLLVLEQDSCQENNVLTSTLTINLVVPNPVLCLILTQTLLFDSNVALEPTKDVDPGNGASVVLLLKIKVTSLIGLQECCSRTNKDVELGTHTTSTNQNNFPIFQ